MRLATLLALAAFLAGCGPNIEGSIKELAKSNRSWCLAATGYGVNVKAGGSGVGDGDMSCGDGGLTLKSQSTQIGVPMMLVPQLSIGQPTVTAPVKP